MKGLVLVLIWLLFKGDWILCGGNIIDIRFTKQHTASGNESISMPCEAKNLSCEVERQIFVSDINYYKISGNGCSCNDKFENWNNTLTDFENELYSTCLNQNSCSFNSSVYTPYDAPVEWLATIEYDCIKPVSTTTEVDATENTDLTTMIAVKTETTTLAIKSTQNTTMFSVSGTPVVKTSGPNSTTVRCNNNGTNTTSNVTTSHSTPAISTALTTQQFPNKNFTEIKTQQTTYMASVPDEYTLSTYPQKVTLSQETNSSESKKTQPITIIVGSSVAVVIVVLICLTVLVVIKRKRVSSRRSSNKENVYNTVRFNKTTANPSTIIMNGVLNLAYETHDIHHDSAYFHSPDRNDCNENEEPFDATFPLESLENVKPKVDRNIQPSIIEQGNEELNSFERQSEVNKNRDITASSVSYTNVTKPNKSNIDAEPDTSENKDDYSSIHINQKNSFQNQTDNYSHILLDSNQISEDISGDKYINVRYLGNNQKPKNTNDDYSHINLKLLENKTNTSPYKGSYDEYSHINTSQFSNHVDSDGQRDRPSVHDYYNVDITEYNHLCLTSTHSEL